MILSLLCGIVLSLNSFSQCDENVRAAFGGISAISLYNTYITIGLIGDNFANETYSAEKVKGFMDEQVTMINSVYDMFAKCQEASPTGLSEEDVVYLKSMMLCLKHLRNQAQGLGNYVQSNSDDDLKQYSENRDSAWTLIEELLGLE